MAVRIADAALRIRATGTEDARKAILRLDGAVKNVGGSVARTTAAMKPLRDRVDLLVQASKNESTRAQALQKLTGVENTLERVLARTNLTLAQRTKIEEQLRRVQSTLRPPPAPQMTTGQLFSGARSALGFLGVTVGAGAATAALGGMARASDNAEAGQRKLAAASKLSGVSMGAIAGIASDAQTSLGLTSTTAADLTQNVVKLTGRANQVNKSGEFMARWMDLAAAQGLSLDEALQALQTTLIGQDEGLNRLGLANPQQIYEGWAKAAGKSAAKMNDAEKAQAIVNAIIETGSKVTGEYSKRLQTAAGKQELFRQELERTAASFGKSLAPTRIWASETGASLLSVLRILNDMDDRLGGMPAKFRLLGALFSGSAGGFVAALMQADRNNAPKPSPTPFGPPISGKGSPAPAPPGLTKDQLEALEKEIGDLTKLRELKRLTAADSARLAAIEKQLGAELKVTGITLERRADIEAMLADIRGKSKKETKSAVEALADEARQLVELSALHAISGQQIARATAIEQKLTAEVKSGTLAVKDRIEAEKALQGLRAAGLRPTTLKDVRPLTPGVDIAKPPAPTPTKPPRPDADNIQRVLDTMDRLKETGGASAEAAADTINERFRKRLSEGKPITLNFAIDQEHLAQAAAEVDSQFQNFLPNIGQTLSDTLGAAFSGGLGNAKDVLLRGLGSIFMEMGKALVSYGVAMMGLLPALTNPFTSGPAALVAGGLLMALGGLLGGLASRGSKGGGGGASSGAFTRPPSIGATPQRLTLDPDRRLHDAVTPGSKAQPLPTQQPASPSAPFSPTYIVLGEPTPTTQRWVAANTKGAVRRNIPTVTRTR